MHPNSGAGHIKDDGSDDEYIYEVKDAKKSYNLYQQGLLDMHRRAAQQGKQGMYIIQFDDVRIECRIIPQRRPQ